MFKILNGYENIDSNLFFEIKESKITRGHNFTLVKKQSRLDVRKFSFSQRTVNVWNKLSEECLHGSSVNMFKNRIDKYHDYETRHCHNICIPHSHTTKARKCIRYHIHMLLNMLPAHITAK